MPELSDLVHCDRARWKEFQLVDELKNREAVCPFVFKRISHRSRRNVSICVTMPRAHTTNKDATRRPPPRREIDTLYPQYASLDSLFLSLSLFSEKQSGEESNVPFPQDFSARRVGTRMQHARQDDSKQSGFLDSCIPSLDYF